MRKDNTSFTPLVSILMTAYNRQQFIAEAIESVLASTYQNWELIIVDDCSSDNTVTIVTGYVNTDTRIKLYINEKNLGDYPNRNKVASYARGELIMFVDSDDMIMYNGIQQCVETLLKFPEASFGIYWAHGKQPPFELASQDAIQRHFFQHPFLMIGPGGTIMRRLFFEKLKGYPVKYGPANDMYFNLKAASLSSVVLIPFDFSFYRRHDGQEINNKYSYLVNNYRFLRDALNELQLPISKKQKQYINKKNKRRFFVNAFRFFFKTKDWAKTKQAIMLADFKIKDAMIAVFQ